MSNPKRIVVLQTSGVNREVRLLPEGHSGPMVVLLPFSATSDGLDDIKWRVKYASEPRHLRDAKGRFAREKAGSWCSLMGPGDESSDVLVWVPKTS